jgi:SAM-dependent methyltransferase
MSSDWNLDAPVMELVDIGGREAKLILDCGASYGKFAFLAKFSHIYSLKPNRPEVVATELFLPYLKALRRWVEYPVRASCTYLPFCDGVFDLAFLCEVLEHLTKDDGNRALEEIRRVSRRQIITTPKKVHEQPELDGNPLQVHRSQWVKEDFKSFGLSIYPSRNALVATNIPNQYFPPFLVRLGRRFLPAPIRRSIKRFLT